MLSKQITACQAMSLLLVTTSSLPLYAQVSNTLPQSDSSINVAAAIDAVLDTPEMQSAQQGIYIVRLRDGKPLYARNADRVFLPASNNKLLTSFAALETLPMDFAYHTRVYAIPPVTNHKRGKDETKDTTREMPDHGQPDHRQPDHRQNESQIKTERVHPEGLVDNAGVLHGDLVIVGGGDPILSLSDLDNLAHQVAQQGIHTVQGSVRYNDSRFDRQWLGDGWTWDDEPASYSAQISALNVNANCIDVQVWPGKRVGTPVRAQTQPATNYVTLVNQATTIARPAGKVAPTSLVIDRERGLNRITIAGNLIQPDTSKPLISKPLISKPLNSKSTQSTSPVSTTTGGEEAPSQTVSVTVEDPACFTGTLFVAALRRAGIKVRNVPVERFVGSVEAMQGDQPVAEHVGVALPELLARMNKPSDNLMAECLLKAVGAFGQLPTSNSGQTRPTRLEKGTGDEESVLPRVGTGGNGGSGATLARRAFLAAGFQANGVYQSDGSGLSRLNYVSPANLVRLLTVAHERPYWPAFYASLPIAGVDGTLRNRLKSTPAQNNCHAKTGTLSHVSSLSGYVTDHEGDLIAFSILINNNINPTRTSITVQDRIVRILADL